MDGIYTAFVKVKDWHIIPVEGHPGTVAVTSPSLNLHFSDPEAIDALRSALCFAALVIDADTWVCPDCKELVEGKHICSPAPMVGDYDEVPR